MWEESTMVMGRREGAGSIKQGRYAMGGYAPLTALLVGT